MIKDIFGYEGLYTIDEYGNVFNILQNKYKIPQPDRDGYMTVQLWKNGVAKRFKIHRLVAIAFIPNPNNYPIVMHKDNNKVNNYYMNLKWGTVAENVQQAHDDNLVPYPKTHPARNIFEIYNNIGDIYRISTYKAVSDITGYSSDQTIAKKVQTNRPIMQGRFKGYYIRKVNDNIIKPFTIEI